MRFNPTMVRLLPGIKALAGMFRLFQSHNGAIAAGATPAGEPAFVFGFNPTMVRLLPAQAPAAKID